MIRTGRTRGVADGRSGIDSPTQLNQAHLGSTEKPFGKQALYFRVWN